MVPLIEPLPKDLLTEELSPEMRILTFRGIEVFALRAEEAPAVMLEVGRIREKEFRAAGAGRGVRADLDEYDWGSGEYRQLVSWDPVNREIVAAYRYQPCWGGTSGKDLPRLRTARLFDYSRRFREEYLPFTIELGRSVVNREAAKSVMGLYTVWSGLGALVREYAELGYFFGNVSLYSTYTAEAKALLLGFLELHHGDPEDLLSTREGLTYHGVRLEGDPFVGSYTEDHDRLLARFSSLGFGVPPILLSYLGAARDLRYLATAFDPYFGDALEIAILVPCSAFNAKARARFIDGYESVNPRRFLELRE